MRKLVVVTESARLVGAIRAGVRDAGAFELLGYLDPRRTSAVQLKGVGAEVVLLDEGDCPDLAIDVIRAIKEDADEVSVVCLTTEMKSEFLKRAFDAGASGAILKAIHPSALLTFLEEALAGHIVHSSASIDTRSEACRPLTDEHLSLTGRELGILRLVAAGATNHEIAQQLWITRQTVKFHLSNIYRKLGVSNRTGACHYAHVNGIMAVASTEAAEAAIAS